MVMRKKIYCLWGLLSMLAAGCEMVDRSGEEIVPEQSLVSLDEVARLLSALPLEGEHLCEVHDAVSASSANGYDEEYMMRDLFAAPGCGVGADGGDTKADARTYANPLRELIREHLSVNVRSSWSGSGLSPERYMELLEQSDLQIYWPYSESWDGESLPVITFDPGSGAEANIGYRLKITDGGVREVEQIVVDEQMATEEPVWVVNRNDDSGYTSLEMLRRKYPEWGTGGGTVIVRPEAAQAAATRAVSGVKTLVLKDFTMLRNYDSWFAGASEFFVKCGCVEDFTASTEAELKLYSPKISDFMFVVKRRDVGKKLPFGVVMVSQWTEQNESMALMITEDDGGTRTEWKCSAVVKIKSKSYGFDVSLPFNTRDDIVWRGQLTGDYIEANDGKEGRFGDVKVTLEFQG